MPRGVNVRFTVTELPHGWAPDAEDHAAVEVIVGDGKGLELMFFINPDSREWE